MGVSCVPAQGADGTSSSVGLGGRKDALSLNVEFVKVHLCRSRKGVVTGDMTIHPSSSASKLAGLETHTKPANIVRFSSELGGGDQTTTITFILH